MKIEIETEIEIIKSTLLTKNDRNSRKHPERQIESLKKSIKEFGFTSPILVNKDNTILAGHGRFEAGLSLEMKEFPCIKLDNLTQEQERLYLIADNAIALQSEWDYDILDVELDFLKQSTDIEFLGLDVDFFDFSIDKEKIQNIDEDLLKDIKVSCLSSEIDDLKERLKLFLSESGLNAQIK